MHLGRLLTFSLVVIGGGLLQLWLLVFILSIKGILPSWGQVLGDGGVFFFATSVSMGSAVSLYDRVRFRLGNADCNISILACLGTLLCAVTVYTAELSDAGLEPGRPFAKYIATQLGCMILSIAYWLYSGVRTGLFTHKDP